LLDMTHKKPPPNIGDKLHLDSRTIAHPVFDKAQNLTYTQQWPPHHALACRCRFNTDHLCRLNIDQGLKLAA